MKTERIFAIFIFIGLLFKFMRWPGAGPLLVLSLSTLGMLYMASFYFFSDKELKNQKIGLSVPGGIILSIACIGILFRLMYWPGGKNMLGIAALGIAVLFGALFYLKGKEQAGLQTYYRNMLIRLTVFAVFVFPLYFASNTDLLSIQHRGDAETIRIKANHFDHPENEAYRQEYQEYLERQRKSQ